jgi:predicted dehydrogenase
MTAFTRRHFFFGSLLAGALPAGGFAGAPSLKRAGYKSPNERLNIACIGAGGRAPTNIAGCAITENIVAFADVDDVSAAPTYKLYEKASRYRDFRRMLEKEGAGIDAVIITAPDHTHTVAAMACMERGKHVYVEKPLAHTIQEIRLLVQAAAKFGVATQMGNQGYSYEGARIAAEIIWSGEIGNVTEVRAWTDRPIWDQGISVLPPEEPVPNTLDWDLWLGPAATRPYSSAYCPFKWRAWYDFGSGALGDIACHALGAVNMALRLGAPSSVEVVRQQGKNPYTFASKVETHFQFPARGAMPPVKIIWTDACSDGPPWRPPDIPANEVLISGPGAFGANGVLYTGAGPMKTPPSMPPSGGVQPMPDFYKRMRRSPDASGAIFVGEKGYLTSDNYGANIRLLPESRHKEYKLPPQVLTRSPGHYQDWIRACKGGEPACSNFSVAAPFSEFIQLGVLASRFEGKLEWDSMNMRITNRPEANEFLRPKARRGWQLD